MPLSYQERPSRHERVNDTPQIKITEKLRYQQTGSSKVLGPFPLLDHLQYLISSGLNANSEPLAAGLV